MPPPPLSRVRSVRPSWRRVAALGIRITGVDDATFSQTGEAYSAIALPNADTHTSRTLQQDDTALGARARRARVTP